MMRGRECHLYFVADGPRRRPINAYESGVNVRYEWPGRGRGRRPRYSKNMAYQSDHTTCHLFSEGQLMSFCQQNLKQKRSPTNRLGILVLSAPSRANLIGRFIWTSKAGRFPEEENFVQN